MNNEIQRKITSLTLMTIMLAGGMVIAAPGMEPAHAANANLFVSTSTFGGPMVVEIIVNDASYKDDDVESMPGVTIDGNDLVMAQGSDGNWYAYVADSNMAAYADSNTLGIDFGTFDDDPNNSGNFFNSTGITFDDSAVVYYIGDADENTVVKSSRSLDGIAVPDSDTNGLGQINLNANVWPFIQTFVFTDDSDIKVIYEAAQAQIEVITYDEDMDDFASYSTDRTTYPHNADIHLVIDDMQLNLDPTDEDIWTFDVLNGTSYYGIGSTTQINSTAQDALFYGTNGFLDIDPKKVIEFKSNDDSNANLNAMGFFYVTVEESSPNTGLFENTDSANNANIITTDSSIRDDSGIIDYNDDRSSILIAYFGGSIFMDKATIDGDWSSGEELTVTVIDEDENTNTKNQDIFDVSDPKFKAIPAIRIGNPITLTDDSVISFSDDTSLEKLKQDNIDLLANSIATQLTLDVLLNDQIGNQTAIDIQQVIVDAAYLLYLSDIDDNINAADYGLQFALVNTLKVALNVIEADIDVQEAIIKANGDQINANEIAIAQGITGSILAKVSFDDFSSRLIVNANGLVDSGTTLLKF